VSAHSKTQFLPCVEENFNFLINILLRIRKVEIVK
jgi:hypothetical protein